MSPSPTGSSRSGPTPLRSRIAGEPYAPAASTTRRARSSPAVVATPTARSPSSTTRSTSVSAMIVRFSRSRTGSRYANPAFQRTVPTALTGCTIAASPHASVKARCHGESSSDSIRRTRICRSARRRQGSIAAMAPAVSPLVIVGRRARQHHARVVRRAAAYDPRAELGAIITVGLPRMREREPPTVEHVRTANAPADTARSPARPRSGRRDDHSRPDAPPGHSRPSRHRRRGRQSSRLHPRTRPYPQATRPC